MAVKKYSLKEVKEVKTFIFNNWMSKIPNSSKAIMFNNIMDLFLGDFEDVKKQMDEGKRGWNPSYRMPPKRSRMPLERVKSGKW